MTALGENIEADKEKMRDILQGGGKDAVLLGQRIAAMGQQELSAADIETLYRGAVSPYINAIDKVVAKPGEIVDKITADIITQSGGQVSAIAGSGEYVVESAANLYEAYKAILNQLSGAGEATLSELNSVTAKMLANRLNENGTNEQQVIDALGDAAGMTFERFGEILADAGIQLTEDMVDYLDIAGIAELPGGNKIKIVDFQAFADLMHWDANSEEYVSAFKAYNDSLIDMNRNAEKNILDEAKNALSAKGGDWVNMTQLASKINTSSLNEKIKDFGGVIENGILKLVDDADILSISQQIAQAAAESGNLLSDELAELADAVADAIKGYADLIKGAISGSLSNSQAEQLQDFATNAGIGDLKFTQTADGLKVATDQAFALVDALGQVDQIQGKLTFDSLVDSLSSDKGGMYENISKTTAELARLKREYEANKAEMAEITDLRDSGQGSANDEARLSVLRSQNAELEKQIDLVSRIQSYQSSNPEQFNFMDRKLPDSMQGPINYWNSIGEAFSAMNEAGSTGKMAINDFYNIVNEMNNLMAISGETIKLGAYELDGSMESAAALIEAGMGSLTNVDGKGVKVNLENLSIDFASGAEGAKNNFVEGVHALAESQIAMLDAAIKVLEVVVAMESLGDISVDDNPEFSFGDVFDLGTPPKIDEQGNKWYEFTTEFNTWRENIVSMLTKGSDNYNADLDAAAQSIKVNGVSLKKMLQAGANEIKDLGITQQEYFDILKAFQTAAASGDYNLDTIQESVWEVLKNSGLTSDLEIDVGDYTIVVNGSHKAMINWKEPNTQEAVQMAIGRIAKDEEEAKEKLKTAFSKFESGQKGDLIETLLVLHAKNKIELTFDDDNNPKIVVDGNEIDPTSVDGQRIIAKAALEAKELDLDNAFETIETDFDNDRKKTVSIQTKTSIGNVEVVVTADGEGNVTYKDTKYGIEAGSLEELEQAMVDKWIAQNSSYDNGTPTELQAREALFGATVKPRVEVKTELDNASLKDQAVKVANLTNEKLTELVKEKGNDYYEMESTKKGYVRYNLGGIEVEVEDTGSLERNLAAAQAEIENSIDADGTVSKIAEGITQAFADNGNVIGEAIANGITSAFSNFTITIDKFGNIKIEPKPLEDAAQDAMDDADTPETKKEAGVAIEPEATGTDDAALQSEAESAMESATTPTIDSTTAIIDKLIINKVNSAEMQQSILTTLFGVDTNKITIPSASGVIETLKVTKVNSTELSTGTNILGAQIGGTSLTIPSANATISTLSVTGVSNPVDFSSVTSSAGSEGVTIDSVNATLTTLIITGLTNPADFTSITSSAGSEGVTIDSVSATLTTLIISGLTNPADFSSVTSSAGSEGVTIPSVSATVTSLNVTDVGSTNVNVSSVEIAATLNTTEAVNNLTSLTSSITTPETKPIAADSATGGADGVVTALDTKIATPQTKPVDADTNSADTKVTTLDTNITTGKTKNVDANTDSAENSVSTLDTNATTPKTKYISANTDSAENSVSTLDTNATAPKTKDVSANTDLAESSVTTLNEHAHAGVEKTVSVTVTLPKVWDTLDDTVYKTVKISASKSGYWPEGAWVKGNVALSKGNVQGNAKAAGDTLMGELGPELVVSRGKYYVVGQFGPEMVNLKPDSVVFNHIQTRELLNKGHTSRYGRAITNERTAVSMVTGNMSGPAMASASAALSALKQLRAMWQSLLGAGLKEMGGNAGSCFAAGTLVSTIDGFKKIEDIEKGDIVLSYNEDTEQNEYSEVLQTMIHFTKEKIYTLFIKDEELVVTGIHRFLITRGKERGWIAAANLQCGDSVLFANGNWCPIDSISIEEKALTVYNFEVSNNHNYYVGSNQILAHNKGGGCFAAGTPVMMQGFYKNIEDVKIGDTVLSYNEQTGKNEYSKVLQTMIHDVEEEIYTLTIEDEKLVVTGIHRFLIERNGKKEWIAAAALCAGDNVLFADGTLHSISQIDVEDKALRVYNFEVSNNHNYYVGQHCILAHNKGGSSKEENKEIAGIVGNVERWYNWLALIEETQNKINILTKKYDLLMSRGAGIEKRRKNLQQQADLLQTQYNTAQQLVAQQSKYRSQRASEMNRGMFGAFYQVDPKTGTIRLSNDSDFAKFVGKKNSSLVNNGKIAANTAFTRKYDSTEIAALQEKEVKEKYGSTTSGPPEYLKEYYQKNKKGQWELKKNKKSAAEKAVAGHYASLDKETFTLKRNIKSGLDFVTELNRIDNKGNAVYSASEQLKMIEALGFKSADLEAGVDKSQEGWEATVVQNFFDKIENDKAEMEALNKSIQEQQEAMLEYEKAIQEINNEYKEMAKPIEAVTDHLEEWYEWTRKIATQQSKINLLSKQYDVLTNRSGSNLKEQVTNLKQQASQTKKMMTSTQKASTEMEEKRANLQEQIMGKTGRALWFDFDSDGNLVYKNATFRKYLKDNGTTKSAKNGKFKITSYKEKTSSRDGSYVRKVNGIERDQTWRDKQFTNLGLQKVEDSSVFTGLQNEYTKKSDIPSAYQKLYTKVDDKWVLGQKGQDKNQRKQFAKRVHDAQNNIRSYDTGVNILDTVKETANFSALIKDPEKFFNKLTSTDANGNATYDGRQQMEILEQMGLGDVMAEMSQLASWETATEEERIDAAKKYLETIKNTPEEYNKLLDQINENKEQLAEYKNQVMEINNQIKELLKPIDGVTDRLEAWYTWTRKTADAQNQLNLLTAKYSNLEKQLGNQLTKKLQNLKDQTVQVRAQIDANKNEQAARKTDLKKYQNEITKGPLGKIFSVDAKTGSVTYNTSKLAKIGKNTTATYEALKTKNGDEMRVINGKAYTLEEYKKSQGYKENATKQSNKDKNEAILNAWDLATVATTTKTLNFASIFENQLKDGKITPEEFINKLTSTKNGKAVYSVQQQRAMLEAAGMQEDMATLYGQGNWNALNDQQRNEAAENYLKTISECPEKVNQLVDAWQDSVVEGENLKGQILEINNQIRDLLKPIDGVTNHLEAWYKWTRKTADAQNQLNLLTARYSNLEKQLGNQTSKKLKNLQDQTVQINAQITANKNEQAAREAEVKAEKKKITDSPLNKIFTISDTGSVIYNSSKLSGVSKNTQAKYQALTYDKNGNERRAFGNKNWSLDELKKNRGYKANATTQADKDKNAAILREWETATVATIEKTLDFSTVFKNELADNKLTAEELINKITATDSAGKAKYSLQQQRAMLEAAGLKNDMATFYGQGSWNELSDEQRNEAAENYLRIISECPDRVNQLVDAWKASVVEGENLNGQILEINNQIRDLLKPTAGITEHLESWYKWTRQTAVAQNKLNKLQAEYNLLEKRQQLGSKITDQQFAAKIKAQSEQIKLQQTANDEELKQRKSERNIERNRVLNNTALAKIFKQNANGDIVYNTDKLHSQSWTSQQSVTVKEIKRDKEGKEVLDKNGIVQTIDKTYSLASIFGSSKLEGGITPQELIEALTKTDATGKAVHSLELQMAVLQKMGITTAELTQFSNGEFKNWAEATQEQRLEAVKNFLTVVASTPERINALNDAIAEDEKKAVDYKNSIADLNLQLKELAEVTAGVQNPFDKWYTWIQRVTKEQDKLNVLTKKYNILQNTRTANGRTQANNLKDQLSLLQQQLQTNNEYLAARKTALIDDLNNRNYALKKMFTYSSENGLQYRDAIIDFSQKLTTGGIKLTGGTDANGVYNYTDTGKIDLSGFKALVDKKTGTINTEDFIKELTKQNANGSMKYNVEEQYTILKAAGFGEGMLYDSSGKKIDTNTKEGIETAVSTLLNSMNDFQSDVVAQRDEIEKLTENSLDIQSSILDIKNELQDNEISLENALLQAIEDREQNKIDQLRKQKDAWSEAADKFINGLQEQLNKEKEMYDRNNKKEDVTKLQRQLAILQRSGGSASQIRSLQDQIKAQQKDIYFDERQAQIDAIKEASDKQLEKLDRQIELAEETLIYNKENGLYWDEVRKIMGQSYNSILAFLTQNSQAMKEQSALQGELTIGENGTMVGKWTGTRNLNMYKKGGLIDFTGPAWVDGSLSNPEGILSADQTDFLRHELIDSLESFSLAINQFTGGMVNANVLNAMPDSAGINIERLDFTMKVDEIASDYDAARAGRQALEEMVKIARKNGNRSISRR